MLRPDYKGGSIVNLMASLTPVVRGGSPDYPPLRALDPGRVAGHRNVVLLVVDGLGYHYLRGAEAGGNLRAGLLGSITSVFPTTTTTAITTFLTGLAPQQHGLTGWYTWFRELGCVLTVLPARPRFGGPPLGGSGIDTARLFDHVPVFDRLDARSHMVAPKYIAHSDFNLAHCGCARVHGYEGLAQMFELSADIVRGASEPSYVYAYWPDFDRIAHERGVGSEEAGAHLAEIDAVFAQFLDRIAGSDTLVIVTADHGFIDSTEEHTIDLEDHPALAGMLALPLCGERRAAFCYLRPDRCRDFEAYVNAELAGCAELRRSQELIAGGWFGRGTPHPRLHERAGDYTLIMKDNFVIEDRLFGQTRHRLVGVHGGLSEEELYVPLMAFTC